MNDPDKHRRRPRSATFRFYEELNDFLPEEQRKVGFDYRFQGTPSVKDAIQAIGVPHTAIDLILVDGRSVDFDQTLHGGERVAVYPVFERLDISPLTHLRPKPLRRTKFIVDAHLGKLARYLRMLGFDAAFAPHWNDEEFIDRSLKQGRIILTRDTGILKQNRVTHGYWIRNDLPTDQLREVIRALQLAWQIMPFSRCMDCNGEIHEVEKTELGSEVDAEIRSRFDTFRRCGACGKVYWRGSHFQQMLRRIASLSGEVLIRLLQTPEAYPHAVETIQTIETHISWVILTGAYAYKIKKPVLLGFLDFSTLEKRKACCEEELRVNRRTAGELYLDVVAIGVDENGLRIGSEPAIEYAVRMHQFDHDSRLDHLMRSGELERDRIRDLAAAITHFHGDLTPRKDAETEIEIQRAIRPALNNFKHLDPRLFSDESQQQLAVIEAWTRRQAKTLRPAFETRVRRGFVRECHGDLHLENILFEDGVFTLFDAIEFNPQLRWIDTANDVAFLAMDLMARDRGDLAYDLLTAWLETTGDYDSLSVMRFYLVYRALVRAVVTSIREQQSGGEPAGGFRPDTRKYIELAANLVDTPASTLYLMHGFSGSGKTWISDRLVGQLPALRVRSDLERKRLPGRPERRLSSGKLESGLYRTDISDLTYATLARHCETGLRAGFSMIADATFLRARYRSLFRDLAERMAARLLILDCQAPENLLRERVMKRSIEDSDASDADLLVLEQQLAKHEKLDDTEKKLTVHVSSSEGVDHWVRAIVGASGNRFR